MAEVPQGPVPPYVAFRTLLTQVERMEKEGVPNKIDKYFLTGMAGGTQNHFRHALRSLGLINEEDRSTELLRRLATTPDQRKAIFAELLHQRFPALTNLDGNASKSDFIEVLQNYGMNSADTQRKALGFYVAAAEYAGVPVSNHVKSGRAPSTTRKSSPRKGKTSMGTTTTTGSATGNVSQPATTAGVMTDDAMRSAYFQLLAKKADTAENPTDLFDRIERLVQGTTQGKNQNRGRKPAGSTPATPTDPGSQVEV